VTYKKGQALYCGVDGGLAGVVAMSMKNGVPPWYYIVVAINNKRAVYLDVNRNIAPATFHGKRNAMTIPPEDEAMLSEELAIPRKAAEESS
jgi:hypothetical protein